MGVRKHTSTVYLINLGLLKEFRDPDTHLHIPLNKDIGLVGTTAFASINSYLCLELAQWDDLESLAYILFYFIWGFLPWQGVRLEEQEILKHKQEITTHDLYCRLLLEFCLFFEHCCSLSFKGRPNYNHFFHLFDNLLAKERPQSDVGFDWYYNLPPFFSSPSDPLLITLSNPNLMAKQPLLLNPPSLENLPLLPPSEPSITSSPLDQPLVKPLVPIP